MASLLRSLIRRPEARAAGTLPLSLDQWANYFSFNGSTYPFINSGTLLGDRETIDSSFQGYVQGAYKRNGVVFACMAARLLIFSEARFQFRQLRNGRPGDLFGTQALELLEEPWPGATTGDLLNRMITDVDLAGNFYATRHPAPPGGKPWIERLRPDWVTIVTGSGSGTALEAELVGYLYQPGGPGSGEDPVALMPEEVAHFAPIPDPSARFRGMSWLTPVLTDITGDSAAISHKQLFFENGATPNLVVTLGDTNLTPDTFNTWVDKMESTHAGLANAYKTLYLAAGADAKVVGSDFKQIDFKEVQGHGETRIAAAARVPPVIVGLSEGLDAATYSNYAQAKRAFGDGTIRPLWRNAAGSLQRIVETPAASQLWYDDRDVPFLREDMKDEAEIMSTEASTIRTLTDGGFTPESVVQAVLSNDWTRLAHTGLLPVQMQPPGAQATPDPALDGANGARALKQHSGPALLTQFIERRG